MVSDFRLIDYFTLLRKQWLYAFVLVIAGGMAGYFYGNANPEIFESSVTVPLAFREGASGTLSEVSQDAAFSVVLQAADSEMVFKTLLQELVNQEINVSMAEIREMSSVTMVNDSLFLSVMGEDPLQTGKIAEVWAEITAQRLLEWASLAAEISRRRSAFSETMRA